MSSFNIGVITDGFKTDPLTALKKAAALGVFGIQVYTFRGPMLPENLTAEFRRNYKKLADDLGLQITATCGEFSHAFRNDVLNQKMIDDMKSQMELAVEFGAPIVTGHIGTIPEDTGSKCYRLMLEGCAQVADFAAKAGVTFAVETGPERSIVLKTFLETINSPAFAANLDPANFVMVAGEDPVEAVYHLRDHIVYTHAKDGRKTPDAAGHPYTVLPLGQGDVGFPRYLKALQEIGYNGWLTVEQECGSEPEQDIRAAVDYLKSLV